MKRIMSIFLSLLICLSLFGINTNTVYAAGEYQINDESG